jgi:hypothetical protein
LRNCFTGGEQRFEGKAEGIDAAIEGFVVAWVIGLSRFR